MVSVRYFAPAPPCADSRPGQCASYDLYGLTEEEDTAVERSLGLIHQTDEEEDAALLKTMREAEAAPKNIAETKNRAEFYAIMRSWRAEELANKTDNQSLL